MTGPVRPASGTGPDATAVYPLGSSKGESGRLLRQADELAADDAALLDRVGLRPGQSAIDLGCGPRGILDLLAERVSPGGRVVGLDADAAHAAMAAEFAAGRGLGGVEIVTADARRTGLPSGSFDLVHARTLLTNVPDPLQVVAEMVRLARPLLVGGPRRAPAPLRTQIIVCWQAPRESRPGDHDRRRDRHAWRWKRGCSASIAGPCRVRDSVAPLHQSSADSLQPFGQWTAGHRQAGPAVPIRPTED